MKKTFKIIISLLILIFLIVGCSNSKETNIENKITTNANIIEKELTPEEQFLAEVKNIEKATDGVISITPGKWEKDVYEYMEVKVNDSYKGLSEDERGEKAYDIIKKVNKSQIELGINKEKLPMTIHIFTEDKEVDFCIKAVD